MRRGLVGFALAAASSLFCFQASGDDARAAMTRAIAAKERAIDTAERSDWIRALELMQAADRLSSTAVSKYELGFVAAQLGEIALAVECYEAALSLDLQGSAAEKARAFLERQRQASAESTATEQPRAVTPSSVPPPDPVSRTDPATQPRAERPKRHDAPLLAPLQRPTEPASHTAKWVLLGSGATLSILALGFVPITERQLARRREVLRSACALQTDGPDTCAHAKPGQWETAQSASDSIALWKTARNLSWVGLGVGVSVLAADGLALLLSAPTARSGA
ncbi:MAG TPA: tetratricopeptide repeat protein, partial [Polyangiaceae bacterium]|nr:tetratricopeptide repeat protein [Polyangiaceae bacterium]